MELCIDLWHQMSADCRSRAHTSVAAQYPRIFGGVAGAAGPWWPLRPLVLSRAFHRDLGVLSDRLAVLVLDACRRRASTAGELLDVLGVPPQDMPLLRRDEPLDERLLAAARADVVLTGGVATFVEINIDGAIGGTSQADLLSARFARAYGPDLPGLEVPPSAVDSRFAQIRRQVGGTDDVMLAIPMYEHGVLRGVSTEAERIRRHQPVVDSARRFGITAAPYPWRSFTTDERGRLFADDQQVDAVLRLFITATEPPSTGLDALVRAVRSGTVQLHTPEASWLLSNKAVFAWLWADLGLLSPEDQRLVSNHVARTILVDDEYSEEVRSARADRSAWVLKPTAGHGGNGVVPGCEVSDDEWHDVVDRATAAGGFVLQRFIDADLINMAFIDDRTNAVHEARVPVVLGPFLFDRTISNVLVRHGSPGGGTVVNGQRGACMNSILIAPNISAAYDAGPL